ncbi:hypothetical protein CPB84DRAFT_860751 [Gymnopilus junonius]|uniref:Uncharacterized protein n=1 Tax=Gymnopilus junonius TaxID=109634 RepID=A0A9P5TP13_GYMJU|nr:hypothetical protein CPB84DRAFT_860751 [Gymnopilus junonius]
MTSRLKKKLGELGVDTASRKANENFCLVSFHVQFRMNSISVGFIDWHSSSSFREIERHRRICTAMEAGSTDYWLMFCITC